MLRYGPVIKLHFAAMTRPVGNDEWLAAAKLVSPKEDIKCSTEECVRKWRHTAKLEYDQKQRYIAEGILRPKQVVTAGAHSQQAQNDPAKLHSHQSTTARKQAQISNLRIKLKKLAPLIALHRASTQRNVTREEWIALRWKVLPDKWPGVTQRKAVKFMTSLAKSAYVQKLQVDGIA